jgi:hypothetical protein
MEPPEKDRRRARSLHRELEAIRKRRSSLPVLDSRSADQIVEYDTHGSPR